MGRWLNRLWVDETGLASVEYSILLALIVVAALTTFRALGCDVGWTVVRVVARLPGGGWSNK